MRALGEVEVQMMSTTIHIEIETRERLRTQRENFHQLHRHQTSIRQQNELMK